MEHFQTLDDLREYVKNLAEFCARPTISGEHPTLYLDHSQGAMVTGIHIRLNDSQETIPAGMRETDYLFSPCKKYVLKNNQMGLSFSAHWQHLKDQVRLQSKHSEGKPVNVYWLLSGADIPSGLKFEADKKNRRHYFLTVTEKMPVERLAEKLLWVADNMSVINDARKAL